MRIERYIARDTRTAMAKVRAQLGADALILANRRVGNQVEVTAAIDLEEALDTAVPPRGPALPAGGNEIQLKSLERELHRLRGILEKELGQRSWRDSAGQAAPRVALRQRLLRMGLSRTLSGAILDTLPRQGHLERLWQQALAELAERLPVAKPTRGARQVTALYGATGVGKTSAIARLAARDLQRHGAGSVGLITLDSYRIGAQEQLASFADILGLPMHVASDAHSLSVALREMSGRRVYIDTAGMGQHDARLVRQYDLIASGRTPINHLLVLSASAQASQCRAIASAFGRRGLSGAIISKIDEAQSLGGVLDVVIAAGLPLFGYSDGQRIPDDFHAAGSEALVARAASLVSSAAGDASQVSAVKVAS